MKLKIQVVFPFLSANSEAILQKLRLRLLSILAQRFASTTSNTIILHIDVYPRTSNIYTCTVYTYTRYLSTMHNTYLFIIRQRIYLTYLESETKLIKY
jgi:hypothetical protein